MENLGNFLPLILIMVVAYLFMNRPQIKRQKDEKKIASTLKRGDKVITKSGLHGKVVELNDKDYSCVIETMAGRLKFDRSDSSIEMSKKFSS